MLSGLLSGIFWAFDTVIISIILKNIAGDARSILLAPLITTFLHDSVSAIFMCLYMMLKKQLKQTIQALKKKESRFIIIASIIAGPIGMSAYIISIKLIGPSLSAIISSLYPAFGSFLAFVFLKEKRKPYQIITLLISILSIMLLGYTNEGKITNLWLGILSALICVIGWSLEAVICTYALQKSDISNEVALQIRQTTSSLFYAIVIINIFRGWNLTFDILTNNPVYTIVISSIFGTASYLFYYLSFKKVGAGKTMALNISYSGFALIVSFLLLHSIPSPRNILLGIIIVISSLVSAYDK